LMVRASRGDLVVDDGCGAACCEEGAWLAEALACPCE
jgi:hypothetical protein